MPGWARAVGIGTALVVLVVLLVTVVLPSQAEDVAADVVAGDWNCDLDYAETDDNAAITTEWDVAFHEDGTVDIEDQYGETAEGEWQFEDGELSVDFGDADLGNPELSTASIDVDSSLDELTIAFTPTADDEDEGVGDRTLSCRRDD